MFSGFSLTWAGECSAWECDDLGHLNMRHYMTKVQQARQSLAIQLGLHQAFKARAQTTLRVKKFHIKYLGEARPGDPLRIESAILNLGETDIQLCHVMYHADGRLACTVIEWADHVYLRSGNAFSWPSRVQSQADRFTAASQPDPSKPRGLTYDETYPAPTSSQLKDWQVQQIGAGVYQPFEIGAAGIVVPQAFLGRTTETLGHFKEAWPEMHSEGYRESGGSGALLEAMIHMGKPVTSGDAYHYYSGLHSATTYTRRLVHNMVDAVTGENLFTMTGIGCLFNLNSRKLVKTADDIVADLNAKSIAQFSA